MIKEDKFLELLDSYSLQEQIRTLVKCLGKELDDKCKVYSVPKKYDYYYGIDRHSSLSALLEIYHLLRLKDDKNE